MIGLPNPWLVAGVLVALAGAALAGYVRGEGSGRNEVQVAWDKERQDIAWQSAKASERARDNAEQLQAKADAQRRTSSEKFDDITSRLDAALGELRKRPSRSAGGADGVPAPAGNCQGATGAGVYAEDADVVIREAARADRIREALGACYANYDAAKATLDSLQK